MSTDTSSLEEAAAVVETEQPPVPAEPVASDKPADGGTDSQDDAATTTPAADEPADPPILAELLGTEAEPKDETPPQDEPPADPPPQEPEQQKPPTQEQQPEAQKPADDGEQDLSAEQERSTPRFARSRIKNLKRKLESAEASVRELEARAIGAGYEKPDEVLEAVDLYGRALKKRDPQALADLDRRLQEAGLKREAPAPAGIPAAKVRELLKAYQYDELERLANESASESQAAQPQGQPAQPPAKQEPPAQAPQQASPQPQSDPAQQRALGELKVLADEVRRSHGDAAQEILAEIQQAMIQADAAARRKTGHGLAAGVWGEEFSAARDAVIARRRDQAKRTPPKALRPSSSASNRAAAKTLTEELLTDAG